MGAETLPQINMGRVRTKTVKRASRVVIEKYYPRLTLDFHTNKKICDEVAIIPSKRLRNKIAGFTPQPCHRSLQQSTTRASRPGPLAAAALAKRTGGGWERERDRRGRRTTRRPRRRPGEARLVVAAAETDDVATVRAVLVGRRGHDVDGEGVEAERLEEVLGVGVGVDGDALGVESRDLGDVVVLALALLLLELERDAANGALLDALHEVGREAGNLVAQALRGDDGNLVADLLVGVEVKGQARVVLLDDDARGAPH